MDRAELKSIILDLLQSRANTPISTETIYENVRSEGHPTSREEVKEVCESLISEGRIDFLRDGGEPRYVLASGQGLTARGISRGFPEWMASTEPGPRPFTADGISSWRQDNFRSTDNSEQSEDSANRHGRGMPSNYQFVENRPEKYWWWYRIALYLLFSFDILTTLVASSIYGTDAEINPVMVWMIEHGPIAIIGINLLALVAVVYAFSWVIEAIQWAPDPYDIVLEILVEIWLGLLLLAGLIVGLNNTAVILIGQSFL